jgi:predicted neuraminidase
MLAILALLFAAQTIHVERIFGPEVPTGPYKHPACFTELKNGDLYLVYYGGKGEYANDTAVFGSRRRKGETKWSAPKAIARDPFRSLGNGVVWQAPDGVVWLFYVVRFGDTWSTSRVMAKISVDNAETWSDASLLVLEEGMMVRNRPIVLADGDYLLPIYHETGQDTEGVGADSSSLFLRYDVKKKRWSETNRIHSRSGNIQPAVVQVSPEHLIAYCRRGGGYGPTTTGWLVKSESFDGGRTWGPGEETQIPNPNAAVDFIKLRNGHLLLVYNDSMVDRTPLTVAISEDGGKTFSRKRNIQEGKNSFAYPIAIQTSDGKIHVLYTSNQRTTILQAVFDEDSIQ